VEIKDFQRMIRETYGERDARRGLWPTFGWLVEEVGELSRALRKGDREEIKREFADAMAWLFTVAELARKYEAGCPKCGKTPCECEENRNEGG
jgi:NTP pyrophosphatase (non-canonical NTP hydrolase)